MTKNVVVTGANRGLGLEYCKQFLEKGYKVYACCRAPESAEDLLKLKQQNSQKLETVPLDVTNPTQRMNLKYTLQGDQIDILVNNAGIYGHRLNFGDVESEEWHKVMEVNTIAPLLLVQELVDLMPQGAKVVLMTSKMGSIADNSSGGSYIYRSTKAALNAVGKSLALDLSGKGVSVAICHPGWVQTDMGGPNALIDTKTSVKGLINVLEALGPENTGQFFNYDGAVIPW
ncbi:SDR family oxidoreductase [Endozoicomonas numazuensis]|uniref:Short-chain dehydrogenase n=1 Tax=Endozoicomonas numazuensis TaxID=1137799 RepID=A0A081NKC2_9GAMM|nr:SDR family oxidoreductase [Endozoicomonas numazuensis]KEQ18895.1 short-chain dehydrogenase [Endozoicomonas numazuensis]